MKKQILTILFLAISLGTWAQQRPNQRYVDYIETYKDLAIEQMLKYNIPASITLAQGLLESAAGYSDLAVGGNNHFGIKCHDWGGREVYHDDDARHECFRAYDNPRESYEDHSKFLRGKQRYAGLFKLNRNDYKGWAHGLKAAGYATNPQYAHSLIRIIEMYGLHQYDNAKSYNHFMVRHEPVVNTSKRGEGYLVIKKCNKNYYVIARQGDTFKTIGEEVGVNYRKLARYNERDKKAKLAKGDIVYLEKKRSKADKKFRGVAHRVKAGESMYSVAQMYGIRLKSLYKMNRMLPDDELRVGDMLRVY